MRRAFVLASLVALAPTTLAQTPSVDAPECVTIRAWSRSDGVGFTHVVTVQNLCPGTIRCELGSDADPTPQSVELRPGESRDVVTRVASPAPGVSARGRCTQR